MTALSEAREHLRKAKKFLEVADPNLDRERCTAATSEVVISGIDAKDAIFLVLVGKSCASESHE
jgi:hypothetical protein